MYNEFDDIILRSLEEDAPFGDITTDVTVAGDATASGVFRAKESGVLCGIDIARRTFELVGGEVAFVKKKADGDLLEKGDIVAEISGNAASILMGERTGAEPDATRVGHRHRHPPGDAGRRGHAGAHHRHA